MNPSMAESYVRDLIADLTKGPRPEADEQGDIPVIFRGCQCYVRIVRYADEVIVQCFSKACEIGLTPDLTDALNDVNTSLVFARAMHVQGQVLIENDMFAEDLNPFTLSRNLYFLAEATEAFGPGLVEKFGAVAGFEPEPEPTPPPPDVAPGLYL